MKKTKWDVTFTFSWTVTSCFYNALTNYLRQNSLFVFLFFFHWFYSLDVFAMVYMIHN